MRSYGRNMHILGALYALGAAGALVDDPGPTETKQTSTNSAPAPEQVFISRQVRRQNEREAKKSSKR